MGWMDLTCVGCGQSTKVAPGSKYRVCDKCGATHCLFENGMCKKRGCNGQLKDRTN